MPLDIHHRELTGPQSGGIVPRHFVTQAPEERHVSAMVLCQISIYEEYLRFLYLDPELY
jgi:hypothetical protein